MFCFDSGLQEEDAESFALRRCVMEVVRCLPMVKFAIYVSLCVAFKLAIPRSKVGDVFECDDKVERNVSP